MPGVSGTSLASPSKGADFSLIACICFLIADQALPGSEEVQVSSRCCPLASLPLVEAIRLTTASFLLSQLLLPASSGPKAVPTRDSTLVRDGLLTVSMDEQLSPPLSPRMPSRTLSVSAASLYTTSRLDNGDKATDIIACTFSRSRSQTLLGLDAAPLRLALDPDPHAVLASRPERPAYVRRGLQPESIVRRRRPSLQSLSLSTLVFLLLSLCSQHCVPFSAGALPRRTVCAMPG